MVVPVLQLQNVCKYYTTAQSVVRGLSDVNLSFYRGEFVAITGESGSGKSTLAHVLGGILPYESGEMLLMGKPTSHFDSIDYEAYRRENISFISQSYGILPGATVLENVLAALYLTGMDRKEAGEKAKSLLLEVELWDLRNRRAAKLSSGQKQRLSIARALAKPAPILIADEPTGNLDPENSARVIKLLALAARERLVLLITHEFSEASEYVTRHITIADGHVLSDLPVQPRVDAPELTSRIPQKHRPLSFWFSRLQIRSRPVWSALVLFFFALTAFGVFAFLGTFLMNLDDTSTRIYNSSAFPNGDRTRIVVTRWDGAAMTDADYAAILDSTYVQAVERYGYLADIRYAWQEGVDYTLTYDRKVDDYSGSHQVIMIPVITLLESADYLQTVPLTHAESFLTAGTLPEDFYQVVAAGSPDLIGQKISLYIQDPKNWSVSAKIQLEVTVVGVTDFGSGLYVHDDLAKALTTCIYYPSDCFLLLPNPDLPETHVLPTLTLYERFSSHFNGNFPLLNLSSGSGNLFQLYTRDQQTTYVNVQEYSRCVEISPSVFSEYVISENCDQVSVTISDYAYMDRVLDQLHSKGYLAISPFREGSTKTDVTLSQQRMQTLTVCALAMLAVAALQCLVLRALFSAQNESYQVLSSVGLSWHTARGSIFHQVLLFTLFGQILATGAVLLCNQLGISRITELLRYLPEEMLLLLSAVHWLISLLAVWFIARGLRKQVYPLVRRFTDLQEEAP